MTPHQTVSKRSPWYTDTIDVERPLGLVEATLNKRAVEDDSRTARRITVTLLAAQSLVSAAFVASGTVSVIAGAQLSGNLAWAGVPASVMQLGTAFASLAVAATTDRIGRRWGPGWPWEHSRRALFCFSWVDRYS
jgi:hypothetical protein